VLLTSVDTGRVHRVGDRFSVTRGLDGTPVAVLVDLDVVCSALVAQVDLAISQELVPISSKVLFCHNGRTDVHALAIEEQIGRVLTRGLELAIAKSADTRVIVPVVSEPLHFGKVALVLDTSLVLEHFGLRVATPDKHGTGAETDEGHDDGEPPADTTALVLLIEPWLLVLGELACQTRRGHRSTLA
jgi:hypothetical protein